MKTILTTFLSMLLFNSFSQKYNICAFEANGMRIKSECLMNISDSSVVTSCKGSDVKTQFKIINKANGVIYITDGVMTHYINQAPFSQLVKGCRCNTMLIFNYDVRMNQPKAIYYSDKIIE